MLLLDRLPLRQGWSPPSQPAQFNCLQQHEINTPPERPDPSEAIEAIQLIQQTYRLERRWFW